MRAAGSQCIPKLGMHTVDSLYTMERENTITTEKIKTPVKMDPMAPSSREVLFYMEHWPI